MPTQDKATRLMTQARTDLIFDGEAFFASLALRLQLRSDETCETAWTDGATLGFNPAFIEKLTPKQRRGLVCHEVMHCAMNHPWRRSGRDARRWNVATDHAINLSLLKSGFELPDYGLADPQYDALSAEAIFGRLPTDPPGEKGDGDDPGGCGETRDAPGEGDQPSPGPDGDAREEDWKTAVLQAAHEAKIAGKLPAGLERLIKQIKQPGCRDVVAALLEWLSRVSRNDYSFQRPNARYLPFGLYMASLYSVSMPPIVAAVDTSGSIDTAMLDTYVGALQRVLDECKPEHLVTIACDASLHGVEVFEPGDPVARKWTGGGGTDFRPAFEEAEKHVPSGMVYLTDLCGAFPDRAPDFPTLWIVADTTTSRSTVPFGDVIYLDG